MYEIEETDVNLEKIDRYYHSLELVINNADNVYLYEKKLSEVIDTKTPRYFLLTRKFELSFKIFLMTYTHSNEFQDEEEYEYYVVEMMGDFWNEFIELKQFSRITKKYIKIVEKEGGREKLIKRFKNFFEKNAKNDDITEKYFVFTAKLVKEWEEKYNW